MAARTRLVAGVDSSTQSCKIVVCDVDTGAVIRSSRASHPDGTEVAADAWWQAWQQATADGVLDGVGALAVGGQQHGLVTLDSDDDLVRDALLWNDNRSATDALDLIDEFGGRQAWADAVGSVPVASMTVAKLRWLARAEPENATRTRTVLLPHDWLTWRIGNGSFEPVTDRGDASGTLYFDAVRNEYRRDLVELALGRSDLRLPRVAAPDEVVGETPDGIKIAPGTGDNMAAGLGLGLSPGEAVVSLGTSGTVFVRSEAQTHEPTGTVAGFADATGAFLPLVCTLNGARNLVATAELLGVGLDEFSRLALSAPAGSEGLTYLPYLEGERTPPLPDARGELSGMTLANLTPANLARATVEGVLWSLAYGIQVLREQTGEISRITLTGGAAQSEAVRAIAPAVFGVPIAVTEPFESVAVGAARQAAWAWTGELPDWPVPLADEIRPTEADVTAASDLHDRYLAVLDAHFGTR